MQHANKLLLLTKYILHSIFPNKGIKLCSNSNSKYILSHVCSCCFSHHSLCVCVCYQNMTAQKTPGRLTRNTNRNTPLPPLTAQSVAPAEHTRSPIVGRARSPQPETRSGHTRGQMDSPKAPASSQRLPAGKLHSPAIHKTPSEKLQSPVIDKSQRCMMESSFVKDFSTDVELEQFNMTQSDEDIAKACGQVEDEVSLSFISSQRRLTLAGCIVTRVPSLV